MPPAPATDSPQLPSVTDTPDGSTAPAASPDAASNSALAPEPHDTPVASPSPTLRADHVDDGHHPAPNHADLFDPWSTRETGDLSPRPGTAANTHAPLLDPWRVLGPATPSDSPDLRNPFVPLRKRGPRLARAELRDPFAGPRLWVGPAAHHVDLRDPFSGPQSPAANPLAPAPASTHGPRDSGELRYPFGPRLLAPPGCRLPSVPGDVRPLTPPEPAAVCPAAPDRSAPPPSPPLASPSLQPRPAAGLLAVAAHPSA